MDMNKPVIFLIEEDNETRRLLRQLLKEKGYRVALAIDEEDALERISYGEFKMDLIIVNLSDAAPEQMLEFAQSICQKTNLNVPIIVMVGNFSSEMEGKNVRVKEDQYIVYFDECDQLFSLLGELMADHSLAIN